MIRMPGRSHAPPPAPAVRVPRILPPPDLLAVRRLSPVPVGTKRAQIRDCPHSDSPRAERNPHRKQFRVITSAGRDRSSTRLATARSFRRSSATRRRTRLRLAACQKAGCAWTRRAGSAQDTSRSALPASTAMLGRFCDGADALTCRPQRARPAKLAADGAPYASEERRWPAVMTSRNVGLRGDGLAASHRAEGGDGPSIKGARTYAHAISSGAVAVLPARRAVIPSLERSRRLKRSCHGPTRRFVPRPWLCLACPHEVYVSLIFSRFALPPLLEPSRAVARLRPRCKRARVRNPRLTRVPLFFGVLLALLLAQAAGAGWPMSCRSASAGAAASAIDVCTSSAVYDGVVGSGDRSPS